MAPFRDQLSDPSLKMTAAAKVLGSAISSVDDNTARAVSCLGVASTPLRRCQPGIPSPDCRAERAT